MRALARLALKVVTSIGTVFIAACYGVPHAARFVEGIVRDAQSRAPIPGILVSCMEGDVAVEQAVTGVAGSFSMASECPEYRAEDVDGGTYGAYATKTVPYAGEQRVDIDLDPLTPG